MTATKPLPPHGTTARYSGNPRDAIRITCRCEDCRTAERRRKKRAATVGKLTVDAAPARAHIRRLLASGASYYSIAATSGCGINTVRNIGSGIRTEIWASTRNRLLAVTAAPDDKVPVPALGSIRRVRALLAIGHPVLAIQSAAGISHNPMAKLVSGNVANIWQATADAIEAAYGALSNSTGNSPRSIRKAAREGWAPPAAWDGIDMSDPKAFPDFTGQCGTPRGFRIHTEQQVPCCGPCRVAWRAYARERYAARRQETMA